MKAHYVFGLLLCPLLLSCGWTERSSVRRTLPGVTQQQALVAAHRVLSDRSYEIESFAPETGVLRTAWRDRAQWSNKVTVTARPSSSQEHSETGATTIEIETQTRDRAIRGWTLGYPRPAISSWLLRRIASHAAVPSLSSPPSPPSPVSPPAPPQENRQELRSCSTTRECPPGHHCGAGSCVWECATDDECEEDARCDRRGRCVPPWPTPAEPAEVE